MKLIWGEVVEGERFRFVSYGLRFGGFWIGWQFTEVLESTKLLHILRKQ